MKKKTYKQFLVKDNMFSPTTNVTSQNSIQPGVYELQTPLMSSEIYFVPKEINLESYIKLPNMVTTDVLNVIENFWTEEVKKKYDSLNIIYKRGILMYGDPGVGKTAAIMSLVDSVVKKGGIAIYNPSPKLFSTAIKALRDIQGDCKVVCVLEEFDNHCTNEDFLGLLDGELQVPNVVFLATTNYIDKIPNNIKSRPSRFAHVIEVGKPSIEARKLFIKHKLPNVKNINEWGTITEGMVIDQIKELITSVECFGMPLKKTSDSIKKLGSKAFVGIKGKSDDEE